MSEKLNLPGNAEIYHPEEHGPDHSSEKIDTSPEIQGTVHENKHKIESIREAANKEAEKSEHIIIDDDEKQPQLSDQAYVSKELKTMAYNRLLGRAQKNLNPFQKPISKFMHQPVVEKASEITATTIGRPSGILGGGIMALVGSTVYYYLTKHYGYNYNFSVFILLLAAGFGTGWIIELLLKRLHKK
ncbi:hypothetical protein H0X09_03530 [Candidatus Saccharibacteria bacterium]|nr:hypothetical protein [Candidatus Saccharibacteria bacterium]